MSIMEPTHLQDDSDVGNKARHYLLASGYLVAAANGVITQSEVNSLASLVGPQVSPDEMRRMFSRPFEEVKAEVESLAKDPSALLTGVQKLQLIRDAVTGGISSAKSAILRDEIDS